MKVQFCVLRFFKESNTSIGPSFSPTMPSPMDNKITFLKEPIGYFDSEEAAIAYVSQHLSSDDLTIVKTYRSN